MYQFCFLTRSIYVFNLSFTTQTMQTVKSGKQSVVKVKDKRTLEKLIQYRRLREGSQGAEDPKRFKYLLTPFKLYARSDFSLFSLLSFRSY